MGFKFNTGEATSIDVARPTDLSIRPGILDAAKAAMAFINIPLMTLLRTFPERPEELGGKRRLFDGNLLLLQSWLVASGRKTVNQKSFELMETFSKYVSRVDDLLDSRDRPTAKELHAITMTDGSTRKIYAMFVDRVTDMRDLGLLTPQQSGQIFSIVDEFKHVAFMAIERFEKIRSPKVEDVLEFKEVTTGGDVMAITEMLNIAENIPADRRETIRNAGTCFSMAAQLVDDMLDIKKDIRDNASNIAVAVLQRHPNELDAVTRSKSVSMNAYRRLAPEAYRELMGIYRRYMDMVPNVSDNAREFKVLSGILLCGATLFL